LLSLLTEENRLLRDYAYNLDPSALTLHQHRFIENRTNINADKQEVKSVLAKKVAELAIKTSRVFGINGLIEDVKAEAEYMDKENKRLKEN
jgi:hypothetical protein